MTAMRNWQSTIYSRMLEIMKIEHGNILVEDSLVRIVIVETFSRFCLLETVKAFVFYSLIASFIE